MREEFLKCLKASAREKDKQSLVNYEYGKITLGMCRYQIMLNNDVPIEIQEKVTVEEFRKWIESLDWKRGILCND